MNVGGMVVVKPIEEWHKLSEIAEQREAEVAKLQRQLQGNDMNWGKEVKELKDDIEKQAVEIEQAEFERDRYRSALSAIMTHMEHTAGGGCYLSTVYNIAKKATEPTGETEK